MALLQRRPWLPAAAQAERGAGARRDGGLLAEPLAQGFERAAFAIPLQFYTNL